MKTYFAHVDDERIHELIEHLTNTSKTAAGFASSFGSSQWAKILGQWHDLGKYSDEFQKYLTSTPDKRPSRGSVDHSTAGAMHCIKAMGKAGTALAFPIAGHHAGLTDLYPSDNVGQACLKYRLTQDELYGRIANQLPPEVLVYETPTERRPSGGPIAASLWIRMLYSCLVDADYLDTEAFFDPAKGELRGQWPEVAQLQSAFDLYMRHKTAGAPDTPVNRIRMEVLERCRKMSSHEPAIFTLTVPTGGGKTLSSMAFALGHAAAHNKRRIIYVIPYTSIIEQTSEQFREIFPDAVVEHHSAVRVESDSQTEGLWTDPARLAAENWDAPIIVTTAVQFFESLFAASPSRCRKLHNIAQSIVVLDEAQLLPPDYLSPIVEAIKELHSNYGVTFVLSTATQPALGPMQSLDAHFDGIPGLVEIMDDPVALHEKLKRVEVRKLKDLEQVDWPELASELASHDSALCVVNKRKDCRELHGLMPEGTYHLSALMCGEHRSEVIKQIARRLRERTPTRVVSTQLVEAGVDLDFPVVYRAIAGLDSIAQAAGRCNREGRLQGMGEVVVFRPIGMPPPGHLRQAAQVGERCLTEAGDAMSPERFREFFRQLYWLKGDRLDEKRILGELKNMAFRTAAQKFKIIDDCTYKPVVVRYGAGAAIADRLLGGAIDRTVLRQAQRFIVNIPAHTHRRLLEGGDVVEPQSGIYVLINPAMYRADVGFVEDAVAEPEELYIG